jgi:hypothetical protein
MRTGFVQKSIQREAEVGWHSLILGLKQKLSGY